MKVLFQNEGIVTEHVELGHDCVDCKERLKLYTYSSLALNFNPHLR